MPAPVQTDDAPSGGAAVSPCPSSPSCSLRAAPGSQDGRSHVSCLSGPCPFPRTPSTVPPQFPPTCLSSPSPQPQVGPNASLAWNPHPRQYKTCSPPQKGSMGALETQGSPFEIHHLPQKCTEKRFSAEQGKNCFETFHFEFHFIPLT